MSDTDCRQRSPNRDRQHLDADFPPETCGTVAWSMTRANQEGERGRPARWTRHFQGGGLAAAFAGVRPGCC